MDLAVQHMYYEPLVLDLSCSRSEVGMVKREPLSPQRPVISPERPEPSPHFISPHYPRPSYPCEYPGDYPHGVITQNALFYNQNSVESYPPVYYEQYERVPSVSPCSQVCHPSPSPIQKINNNNIINIPRIPREPNGKAKTNDRDDVSESGSDNSGSSSLLSTSLYTTSSVKESKAARPFKAYLKDPFTLASGFSTADTLLNDQSAHRFSEFRKKMLDQIREANGGHSTVSNPKMRRSFNRSTGSGSDDGDSKNGEGGKDLTYFEKRRKNNEAAKKSRDRRRIKEDEIAIRAAFLERENIQLKFELAAARKQLQHYGIQVTE